MIETVKKDPQASEGKYECQKPINISTRIFDVIDFIGSYGVN